MMKTKLGPFLRSFEAPICDYMSCLLAIIFSAFFGQATIILPKEVLVLFGEQMGKIEQSKSRYSADFMPDGKI